MYENEYKQKIETGIRCAINTKEDYILNVPHFSMDLDFNKKSSIGRIVYFFAGTEDYRKEALSTSDKTDFTINEKYVAINFFSENLNDMAFLAKELHGDAEWYKNLVNAQYLPLLENAKYAEELIWLYENAADFTLAALKPETLWKHICTFYKYDTTGKFSFLKDASKQLMRALFAFNTPEKIKYLMGQLVKNQLFVKKIYDALDGTMVFNGKEQKCQTIFASIITGFCFTDTSTLSFTNEIFSVGKDYYVNVKDVEGNKELEKYQVEQVLRTEDPYTDNNGTTHYDDVFVLESSIKLNPLDIVTVLQKDTDSLMFVPILFLKDQDHQKDVENLLTAVRIGVDMLAIGLTVATLGGASPLLAVAGALEIAIAATDIAVMTNKDQLSEEFVKTWDKIYVIGGIATASPSIVSSLYKLGGKILASSVKEEMKNYVRSCMMKMILESEIGNFSKNTLKIVNYEKLFYGYEYKRLAKTLLENGVMFVEGDIKLGNTIKNHYGLVYKGETLKTVSEYGQKFDLISSFWRLEGEKLTLELENLFLKARYERILPEGCEVVFKDGSYAFKDLNTRETVGLLEIKDDYLEFAIYRKGLKTTIAGKKVFNSLIANLEYQKIPFKGIRGLWSSASDNTIAFNEAVKQGLSAEKAAFRTWTGQRALEQGFNKVKIDKLIPNNPPYTNINVTFINN